jgi:tetratricopeptide (TPR) repeat protein
MLVRLRRFKEAEALFGQARDLLKPLVRKFPANADYQASLSMALFGLAQEVGSRGDWAGKRCLVEKALRHERIAWKLLHAAASRQRLQVAYFNLADTLVRLHEPDGALKAVGEAAALSPDDPTVAVGAARCLAVCATLVEKELGLAEDRRKEWAGTFRDRAMHHLKVAAKKDYRNARLLEFLKKAQDFKALRSRDDFQKLLAELEKAPADDS